MSKIFNAYLLDLLHKEYHNFDLWYFVSFSLGIIYYFSSEAEQPCYLLLGFALLGFCILYKIWQNIIGRFILMLFLSFLFGVLISQYKAYYLQSNIALDKIMIARLSGKIESINYTDAKSQIILCNVSIDNPNLQLPKVKITIAQSKVQDLSIGNYISLKAKLYPLQSYRRPLPYSQSYALYYYFESIKATGYAISSPIVLTNNQNNQSYLQKIIQNPAQTLIHKIRTITHNRIINALDSYFAGIMNAILLGESRSVDKDLMNKIRSAGISHILCVSGLHLSLVAAICFTSIRMTLNLSSYIAYKFNIKIIAGIFSIFGSYVYLLLTGMQIAATRAFIMTSIFIIAIILDRNAHHLRSIMIAATIILCVNPEYIFHPSFQLSFVAVLSLISGYEFYKKHPWVTSNTSCFTSLICKYFASNIYSSFLASIVTAPVIISHFYTFPTYCIIMNLIAVPIVSFILMPLGIVSILSIPFSLEVAPLKLAGIFIDVIIYATNYINNLPYSTWYFGYIIPTHLLLFVFGFFWLCFWQSNWRFLGIMIMLISCILMIFTKKADAIINFNDQNFSVAIKNINGSLNIYSNQDDRFFNEQLTKWFGLQNFNLLPLSNCKVMEIAYGRNLVINDNQCLNIKADIQLNMSKYCKKLSDTLLNKKYLYKNRPVEVFCSKIGCKIRPNTQLRFLQ
ncbi:MAG: ComEC/Rec2 family competence protein [Rickettsiaceae bacterium]